MIINLFSYRKVKRRNYKGKMYFKFALVYAPDFLKFKEESRNKE